VLKPEKSESDSVTADVAVSNDKVSFDSLPVRVDADAANNVVEEKVNLAMAFFKEKFQII
jgi:hypothetical protein